MLPTLPLVLSFLLLLSGCGGTARSMRAAPSDLRGLPPSEGVAVGSMAIHAGPRGDNTTSLLSGLKGKKWGVIVTDAKKTETVAGRMALAAMESSGVGQLEVVEGEEKPFVMILPAGDHLFLSMTRSSLTGTTWTAPLRVPFRVAAGKKTYVGRLVVQMPEKMDTFLGLPTGVQYKVLVEDAQEETIGALRKEYGDLLENVERDLMGERRAAKLPGGSIADVRLQQDILSTVWMLEGAWDNTCKERKVVDTMVTISAQRPGIDPWTERWTVERCGKVIDYIVELTPGSKAGTDFKVRAGTDSAK